MIVEWWGFAKRGCGHLLSDRVGHGKNGTGIGGEIPA